MIVEKLADLGHRRVAYVSGEPAMLPIRQRLAAFKCYARNYGFDDDPKLFERAMLSFNGGYEAGQRIWKTLRKKPTAIVTFSDVVAVGLLRFLESEGVTVPDTVSVASFDGTAVGEFTHTTLTTIHTPMYEIGQRAFQLLLGAMAGEFREPQSMILPVELRLRQSIGKVKAKPSSIR
jgi:DNA-binding LacI/PurR family transcriptional regulator